MKHITANEFIFTASFEPVQKDAQKGKECEHKEIVHRVDFYHSDYGNYTFHKISLSRNEILELAEKIKEIESNTKIMIYEPMPF